MARQQTIDDTICNVSFRFVIVFEAKVDIMCTKGVIYLGPTHTIIVGGDINIFKYDFCGFDRFHCVTHFFRTQNLVSTSAEYITNKQTQMIVRWMSCVAFLCILQ